MGLVNRIVKTLFCCVEEKRKKSISEESDVDVVGGPRVNLSPKEKKYATGKKMDCDASLAQNQCALPPKKDSRPTLILDLDNTLVCPTTKCPSFPAHEIEVLYNGRLQTVWVIERPHLQDFIEAMEEKYEIVVFTAGIMQYGHKVLEKIDPKKRVSYLLDRSHCVLFAKNSKNQEIYVKNLDAIGRDLRQTIIVDDKELSYAFNPENGQIIPPFYGEKDDDALLKLKEYLLECVSLRDFRTRIPPKSLY